MYNTERQRPSLTFVLEVFPKATVPIGLGEVVELLKAAGPVDRDRETALSI